MKYEGDFGAIQRRLAKNVDQQKRRLAILDAIAPQPGEKVLDVGCGGGALLPLLAAAVGDAGHVAGIDVSADQIAAARELTMGNDVIKTAVEDVSGLSFEDGSFDAVTATQVIEYLEDPGQALAELRRVSSAHGRLVIYATNWDTMFWNCGAPELTERVKLAWREHCPQPNLPAELRPLLARAGFRMVRQEAVPITKNTYHAETGAYWAARLILAFCIDRGLISRTDADAWTSALEDAQSAGTFFYSLTPIITTAVAV